MKRILAFVLCVLFASHAGAWLIDATLRIGNETASVGDSDGWNGNYYFFTVDRGSAYVHRTEKDVWLYLDSVLLSGKDIYFHGGNGARPLHIVLSGQNLIDGGIEYYEGGISTSERGRLSIHGAGSLSMVYSFDRSGVDAPLSVTGENLWIGEGAVLSIVCLSDYEQFGQYAVFSDGTITILNASVGIQHAGFPRSSSVIAKGSMEIVGSVVVVGSAISDNGGSSWSNRYSPYRYAMFSYDGDINVLHSSVTVFSTAGALQSNNLVLETSALGVVADGTGLFCTAVSATGFSAKDTIGLVISDGEAISAARQEYLSGNDLTIIGSADGNYDASGLESAIESTGGGQGEGVFHKGGKTTLFAPKGTGILAGKVEVTGGTLTISKDPDWEEARRFFTASSIAASAETVLQGGVSGNITLSLLENFFADEAFAGLAGLLTEQVSSARTIRGISAGSVLFKGGTTDVTCQTDANGIVYSRTATVSGGRVRVNGKAWGPSATVSFNANGGTVSPKSRKVSAGGAVGPLPTPKRAGFAFIGWFTAKSGGRKMSSSSTVSSSTTLYAHWARKTYNVAFDANGGRGTTNTQTMKYGKAAKLRPNGFSRSGYTFLGWAKTKGGALAYKNRQAVKNLTTGGGTIKLYAKWGRNVTVKFNANGGTVSTKSKKSVAGGKLGTIPSATRKDWTFEGWWTKETGGKRVTASTSVKKTMTVYAHWTPLVTLKLNPNGGRVAKTTLKCRTSLYKGSYYLDTSWIYNGKYSPTHSTCSFQGWYTKKTGGTALWNVKVKKPSTLTLFARWEPAFTTIWFWKNPRIAHIDDSTPYLEERYVRVGSRLGSLPEPETRGEPSSGRDSLCFDGWVTSDGRKVSESTVVDGSFCDLYQSLPLFSDIIQTETVNGITWSFYVADGCATIFNDHEWYDSNKWKPAIDPTTSGSVVIPRKLGGAPVTGIGPAAFYGCGKIVSVDIPETVSYIGPVAFGYCSSLTELKLPSKLSELGDWVLAYTSFYELVVPKGVKRIGQLAVYSNRNLMSVILPDGLESIDYSPFHSCDSLQSITIPASVTDAGEPFYYVPGLKRVYLSSTTTLKPSRWDLSEVADDFQIIYY